MTFYNQMTPDDRCSTQVNMDDVRAGKYGREASEFVEAAVGGDKPMMLRHDTPLPAIKPVASPDLRTITIVGIEVTLDPTVFDDFELLEALANIQKGDVLALPAVFRAVAGDKAQALLDAVRDGSGRVTATAATELLVQIMSAIAPKA